VDSLTDKPLNSFNLGKSDFHEISLNDIEIYSEYIKATEYPANLWSSNFAYLWASSQSSLRRVLWKIVDAMLVTFGLSYKNTLYLFCLPFGEGGPEKVAGVIHKCLKYCYEWNHSENGRTLVRMINHNQLEFLQSSPGFNELFRLVTLEGIERHLEIGKLVSLPGKDFSTVRNKVNKFHRENPGVFLRCYRKNDCAQVMELGKRWEKVAGRKYPNIFDKVYYREMVKYSDQLRQIVLVAVNDDRILGLVAGGELPTGQAWGSLLKYEGGITGLSELLSVEFARELHRINPELGLMNVGSDLKAGGLREYKLKFRPVLNLKRYQVFLK
jgi:hypothetical protein